MKSVAAIKEFFQSGPHGRKVETKELMELSKEERHELGKLSCEALGVEHTPST